MQKTPTVNIPLNTEVGFFGPPPSYLPYKEVITQSKNY